MFSSPELRSLDWRGIFFFLLGKLCHTCHACPLLSLLILLFDRNNRMKTKQQVFVYAVRIPGRNTTPIDLWRLLWSLRCQFSYARSLHFRAKYIKQMTLCTLIRMRTEFTLLLSTFIFSFGSCFLWLIPTKSRIIQRAVITGYNPWFWDSIKKIKKWNTIFINCKCYFR